MSMKESGGDSSRTPGNSLTESSGDVDWRAQLQTIFVDRLSKRVSKRALSSIFNSYGVVVDCFIPSVYKRNGSRFTYAFVRFKY